MDDRPATPGAPEITVFFDGECPLCRREVAALRRLDRGRNRIGLLDIAAPDFDPHRLGLQHDALMSRIHGQLPDGRIVEGVEVFRRAYAAVGLGWLLAWTRWPGLSRLADAGYRWFARNRLRLTGRRRAAEHVCPRCSHSA
jgi:predicted DCC family thiol-disulfide oxidoreductase YuxK